MKLPVVLIGVLGAIIALSSVGATISYYNNSELSAGNTMNSALLNLGVSPSDFTPPAIAPGESSAKTVTASNLGGMDFQYSVMASNFSGDDAFCHELDLTATLDGKNVFSGKLTDFISTATSSHYSWQFTVALPPSAGASGTPCNFDFIFKAWQTNVATFDESGYRDSETIQNTISRRVIELPPAPLPHHDDDKDKDKDKNNNQDEHDDRDNHDTHDGHHGEHDKITGESSTTPPIIDHEDGKKEDTAPEPTPTPSPTQTQA
jgi:hypothetical protein